MEAKSLNLAHVFKMFLFFVSVMAPDLQLSYAITEKECTPVQLSPAVSTLPVLDQGHLPICYACAAADLASAYIRTHAKEADDFQVSPFHLALQMSEERSTSQRHFSDDPFAGGSTLDGLKMLKKKGSVQF